MENKNQGDSWLTVVYLEHLCFVLWTLLLHSSDAVYRGCILLAGMLLMGFALRNIPVINIAKDIDHTWSSALRSAVLSEESVLHTAKMSYIWTTYRHWSCMTLTCTRTCILVYHPFLSRIFLITTLQTSVQSRLAVILYNYWFYFKTRKSCTGRSPVRSIGLRA